MWDMEGRLGVKAAFRFPMYKELMWHAAQHYLTRAQAAIRRGVQALQTSLICSSTVALPMVETTTTGMSVLRRRTGVQWANCVMAHRSQHLKSCVNACSRCFEDAGIAKSGPQNGGISRWELEGLHPLLDALVGWLGRTRRGATTNIPSGITNPAGALLAPFLDALPGDMLAFVQVILLRVAHNADAQLQCMIFTGRQLASQE